MSAGVRQWAHSTTVLRAALALCVLACFDSPASGALPLIDRRAPHVGSGAAAAATRASSSPASPVDGKKHGAFGGSVSEAAPSAVSRSLAPPAVEALPSREDAPTQGERSSSASAAVGRAFEVSAPSPGQGNYGGDLTDGSANAAHGAAAESNVAEEGTRVNAQQQQQPQPQQQQHQQQHHYQQQQQQQNQQQQQYQQPQQQHQQQNQQQQQYQQPQQQHQQQNQQQQHHYRQQQQQHHYQQQQHQSQLLDGGHGGGAAETDAAVSEEFRWSGLPPMASQSVDGGVEAEHADYY